MSDFRIKTMVLGMVGTCCYIVYHEKTREAVIIDPADDDKRKSAMARSRDNPSNRIAVPETGEEESVGPADEPWTRSESNAQILAVQTVPFTLWTASRAGWPPTGTKHVPGP